MFAVLDAFFWLGVNCHTTQSECKHTECPQAMSRYRRRAAAVVVVADDVATSPGSPPAVARATGGLLLPLRSPNDLAANARIAAFVQGERTSGRPKNTALVYDPKIKEFEEFCDHNYSNDPYRYNMTREKSYRFVYYTGSASRNQRAGRNRNLGNPQKRSSTNRNI